jgi:hypothetical protein
MPKDTGLGSMRNRWASKGIGGKAIPTFSLGSHCLIEGIFPVHTFLSAK